MLRTPASAAFQRLYKYRKSPRPAQDTWATGPAGTRFMLVSCATALS